MISAGDEALLMHCTVSTYQDEKAFSQWWVQVCRYGGSAHVLLCIILQE